MKNKVNILKTIKVIAVALTFMFIQSCASYTECRMVDSQKQVKSQVEKIHVEAEKA